MQTSKDKVSFLPQCRCPEVEPGAIAEANTSGHLIPVSGAEDLFLVCPQSGVLWRRSYHEERVTVATTVRTEYQQPKLSQRTVAVARLHLCPEPRSPLQFLDRGCGRVSTPLLGLVWSWVRACQPIVWHCGQFRHSGKLQLGVWLEFVNPLNAGESDTVAVASPLECIAQASLLLGNTFEVLFGPLGCTMGEFTILGTEKISWEEFVRRFDYFSAQRNLYEEWWSIAREEY